MEIISYYLISFGIGNEIKPLQKRSDHDTICR